MQEDLSEFEQSLLELTHFLASEGLTVRDVYRFLDSKSDARRTVMERLRSDGKAFVNELKIFVNQSR
jgi:chromosome segregation and condensation protein ScpB